MTCAVWMVAPPVLAAVELNAPLEELGIATGSASIVLLAVKELASAYGGARLRQLGASLDPPIIGLVAVFCLVLVGKILEAV